MINPVLILAALALLPATARAQTSSPAITEVRTQLSYARLVDLVLQAPVIVRATIAGTQRIPPRNAPGLQPGQARLLMTADVTAALVAPGGVAPSISWLQDVTLDARGRPPALRGQPVLAWTDVPDNAGRTRLIAPDAQQPWQQALEDRVRAIATEVRSATVPVVTGVSNGFRVAGTLPGESESQFFLSTKEAKPLTIVVLERPGQARSIAVASGDIIDESATPVKPETLLWYRLACSLPPELPRDAGGNDPALANAWLGAIASLGSCTR